MIDVAKGAGVAGSGAVQMLIGWALAAAFVGPAVEERRGPIVCVFDLNKEFGRPAISISPVPIELAGADGRAAGAGQGGICPATAGIERDPEPPLSVQGRPLVWASGRVEDPVMCARIGADGRVESVALIRGSTDPALDREAMRALAAIRFTPAQGAGGPRASRHVITGHVGVRGYHYVRGE